MPSWPCRSSKTPCSMARPSGSTARFEWRRGKRMRAPEMLLAVAMLAVLSGPALAEPRWLGCKFADGRGSTHNFSMVFDDLRGTAAVLEEGQLIEGTNTSITF